MRILVATHKPYWMPDDDLYLPIQVDGDADLGFVSHATGENIAAKGWLYNELTALYWAWKNLPDEFIGLNHYRRYFTLAKPLRRMWVAGKSAARNEILRADQLLAAVIHKGVVLAKPRNYFIETNASQYVHAHGSVGLDAARKVLAELHPEQVPAFDEVMKRTWGHRFNMLIMRRPILDAYCTWLFGMLDAIAVELGQPQPRSLGFIAERLMDVWLLATQQSYAELPVLNLERTDWLRKGGSFLRRKFS